MIDILFPVALAIVAILYSAVGQAGGTGYVALMGLSGLRSRRHQADCAGPERFGVGHWLHPVLSLRTAHMARALVPHEAEQEVIREMVALRAQGKALRAIAAASQARGHRISHEGVAGVLRAAGNLKGTMPASDPRPADHEEFMAITNVTTFRAR